jgi:hypothetical protein
MDIWERHAEGCLINERNKEITKRSNVEHILVIGTALLMLFFWWIEL